MLIREIINETIKIGQKRNSAAKDWINKVYSQFEANPIDSRQSYMVFGEKPNQQVVVFELVPSFDVEGAVEIKWMQSTPTGSGAGRKAIKILQDLATQDNIPLTLFPWEDSDIGQDNLIKFYKSMGFKPIDPGYPDLVWNPGQLSEVTRITIGKDEWGTLGSWGKSSGRPEKVRMLPVNRIKVHEPDTKFDDPVYRQHLERVKAALRRGEKIEPIIVRRMPGELLRYQVLDGHHRFKAYRDLGLKEIPAQIVHKFNVTDLTEDQYIQETAEELQELAQFSKLAAEYLIQYYLREISDPAQSKFIRDTLDNLKNNPEDHVYDVQLIPDINLSDIPGADLLRSPGLQLLKQYGRVNISALAPPKDPGTHANGFSFAPGGHYRPGTNTIEVDVNQLHIKNLTTVLIHEFQHAIDDFKSRRDQRSEFYGRALWQTARGKNPDEKFLSYLQLPHEVNARFAEVITALKTAIEDNTAESDATLWGKPTLASWMPYIRELFKHFQIDEAMPQGTDDPRYRKLLKRAYVWVMKFYQDRFHSATTSEPNIYITDEQNQRSGPFTFARAREEIRKRNLDPHETYVWWPNMPSWDKLSKHPGLMR